MKMILEKMREYIEKKTYLAFLRRLLTKCQDRSKLWQTVMRTEHELPPELLRAVKGMYIECKSAFSKCSWGVFQCAHLHKLTPNKEIKAWRGQSLVDLVVTVR